MAKLNRKDPKRNIICRQCHERIHQAQPRVHVQLQPGDAVRHDRHGLHGPLRQGQQAHQVKAKTNLTN